MPRPRERAAIHRPASLRDDGKRLEYRSHINSVERLEFEGDQVKKFAWHMGEHSECCGHYVGPGPSTSCVTSPLPSGYFNDVTSKAQVPSALLSEYVCDRIVEFTLRDSLRRNGRPRSAGRFRRVGLDGRRLGHQTDASASTTPKFE